MEDSDINMKPNELNKREHPLRSMTHIPDVGPVELRRAAELIKGMGYKLQPDDTDEDMGVAGEDIQPGAEIIFRNGKWYNLDTVEKHQEVENMRSEGGDKRPVTEGGHATIEDVKNAMIYIQMRVDQTLAFVEDVVQAEKKNHPEPEPDPMKVALKRGNVMAHGLNLQRPR